MDWSAEASISRTIADQLLTIPGMSLNGQGGQFQSYAIRGISRNRIRTDIDGVPILTDRAAGNAIGFLPTDLITSASVLKGPNSAVYGSQALGGVVSLSTEMTGATQMRIRGMLTNPGLSVTGTYNTKNLGVALAAQYENNTHAPSGDELNTGFQRMASVLRYQKRWSNLHATTSWINSIGTDIQKSNRDYPSKSVSDYPSEWHSIAQIHLQSNTDWSLRLFHHYQDWTSRVIPLAQDARNTHYQSHTLGAQFLRNDTIGRVNHSSGVDWVTRQGVDIIDENALPQSLSKGYALPIIDGKEHNFAAYSNSRWGWYDNELNFTLRYDTIEQKVAADASKRDQQWSGSFPMKRALNDRLLWFAELANGFRYPTLSERFFTGNTARGVVIGVPELAVETSVGTQLGFRWAPESDFSLNATQFSYRLDDYIQRYNMTSKMLSYRNVQEAKLHGFEIDMEWTLQSNGCIV